MQHDLSSRRTKVLHQQDLPGYGIFIECCCDPKSGLGNVSEQIGLSRIRLSEKWGNISDKQVIDQLGEKLREPEMRDLDLWASLPCKPWTSWQRMNIHRYGASYLRKLLRKQLESRKMLKTSIQIAEIVLAQGGRVHFEWPSHCQGWRLVELQDFCNRHQLHLAKFNACAFGSEHFKPWTIATSSEDLASMLRNHTCQHEPSFKHVPCEGGKAEKSALYPPNMCEAIIAQLFPKKFHQAVPSMPVVPTTPQALQRMSMRFHCQSMRS